MYLYIIILLFIIYFIYTSTSEQFTSSQDCMHKAQYHCLRMNQTCNIRPDSDGCLPHDESSSGCMKSIYNNCRYV